MSTTPKTDQVAERIANLLNKAESTEFGPEAEAFLAKAQALMARHAIDEAMLANARGTSEQILQVDLTIVPPYASAKVTLLGATARANRCQVVSLKLPEGRVLCTVFGQETDIANTRHLYFSLSHQAVRFMLEAPVPPGDTKRRFRHSFLLAYGYRIGERLARAAETATSETTGQSVALVLATREAKVEQAMRAAFPRLRNRSVSASSGAGIASGRAAADRSALNQPGVRGGGLPLGGGSHSSG